MAETKVTRNRLKVTSNKAKKKQYFPQILRKIPAWLSWRLVVVLIIVSLLLLNLIRFGQNLYSNYQETKAKQMEKRLIEAQIEKWEKMVQERPNYRDAYFELAVLTYRLNRIDEAKKYLAKVYALDPNFAPAREFEKMVDK